MPQAIHESTAFNSRNRKVAIHCVFSVKDNTHWQPLIFLLNKQQKQQEKRQVVVALALVASRNQKNKTEN